MEKPNFLKINKRSRSLLIHWLYICPDDFNSRNSEISLSSLSAIYVCALNFLLSFGCAQTFDDVNLSAFHMEICCSNAIRF